MSTSIFKRFGENKNSLLLATIHNSKESIENIKFVLKNYKFNKYLIELNSRNYNFIQKNNFKYSEFHQIIDKEEKNLNNYDDKTFSINRNLFLIDISIEKEIFLLEKIKRFELKKTLDNNYNHNKINIIENIISFKLSKHILYKIMDLNKLIIKNKNNKEILIDFTNLVKNMNFYKSHILFREFFFLTNIAKHLHLKKNFVFENDTNLKKYFGDLFEFFIKEESKNINANDISKNHLTNEGIIVIIGQLHFENFIKNNLLE